MPSPDRLIGSPLLPDLWHQWAEVVSRFALKQRDRRRLPPADYESLYNQLVGECRRQASINPERRQYFEDLAELVAPWLNIWALERTDTTLLLDLLDRCRRVDQELGGYARWTGGRVWVYRMIASVGLFAVAAAVVRWFGVEIGNGVSDSWRSLVVAVKGMSDLQRLLAVGIVAGIVFAGWVLRVRRV